MTHAAKQHISDEVRLLLGQMRWRAEFGLSGFRNLTLLSANGNAQGCLEAVVEILDDIDRLVDGLPPAVRDGASVVSLADKRSRDEAPKSEKAPTEAGA